MKILVNGEETNIARMSIYEYLQSQDMDTRLLAIELNKEILPKKDYHSTMIEEDDHVEIVWFVGGGNKEISC